MSEDKRKMMGKIQKQMEEHMKEFDGLTLEKIE